MAVTDSELKILEVLWEHGELRASVIAKIMEEQFQWKMTTTYTILKICVEKAWVIRKSPHYVCSANISKEKIQHMEISDMMSKYFNSSPIAFLNAFVESSNLTEEDIFQLKQMISKLENNEKNMNNVEV